MITLMLNEQRANIRQMVFKAFSNEVGVEIVESEARHFYRYFQLDAYIATHYEAHELYRIGDDLVYKHVPTQLDTGKTSLVSEVIITPTQSSIQRPEGFPQFAVVAPVFPAHAEFPDNDSFEIVRNDSQLTVVEMTYIIISQSFEAVKRFNRSHSHGIQRLGLVLKHFGIPAAQTEEDQVREIEAIRTCFRQLNLTEPHDDR